MQESDWPGAARDGKRPASHSREKPAEPGLYLARNAGFDWWNLIIEISGKSPYLYERVLFDRSPSANGSGIFYGPRIEQPPVLAGLDEKT